MVSSSSPRRKAVTLAVMSSLPAGMVRACSQAGDVVYEEARPLLNQSIPVSRARSLIAQWHHAGSVTVWWM